MRANFLLCFLAAFACGIRQTDHDVDQLTEEIEVPEEMVDPMDPTQRFSPIMADPLDPTSYVEEQWLNKAEQDIKLATLKAEMNAALEAKDREIVTLRSKCRILEMEGGQANLRWQKKVDELKSTCAALEAEKDDMIEKMNEAKTQAVKAVLIEEEAKREALKAEIEEMRKKLNEANSQFSHIFYKDVSVCIAIILTLMLPAVLLFFSGYRIASPFDSLESNIGSESSLRPLEGPPEMVAAARAVEAEDLLPRPDLRLEENQDSEEELEDAEYQDGEEINDGGNEDGEEGIVMIM